MVWLQIILRGVGFASGLLGLVLTFTLVLLAYQYTEGGTYIETVWAWLTPTVLAWWVAYKLPRVADGLLTGRQ